MVYLGIFFYAPVLALFSCEVKWVKHSIKAQKTVMWVQSWITF